MRKITAGGLASSAIDTSDGVLACAQIISDTARVGIELFPEELAKFVNRDVINLADSLGVSPFLFALSAGYDWEVICTVPKSRQNALNVCASRIRSGYPPAAVIGEVVPRRPSADMGVSLRTANGPGKGLPYFTGEKFRSRTYARRAREWLEFAIESTRLAPSQSTRTEAREKSVRAPSRKRCHSTESAIPRATNSPRSVILVGAGRRGLGAHLPALDACGYFRLAGIVDTKERIARLREIPALARAIPEPP